MKLRHWMWGAACLAFSWSALARQYTLGPLAIGHPYARATVQGQPVGGGYLKLVNQGKTDDRLIGVTAEVSQSVELHSMSMDGSVARMRQVDAIDVPAGQTVELKPGGLHLMFLGLKAPLKAGTRFPATLKFEKAGEVEVDLVVQDVLAPAHVHPK